MHHGTLWASWVGGHILRQSHILTFWSLEGVQEKEGGAARSPRSGWLTVVPGSVRLELRAPEAVPFFKELLESNLPAYLSPCLRSLGLLLQLLLCLLLID